MADVQSHWEAVAGLTDSLVALHNSHRLSTREIANELSDQFKIRVSRNAVIGKLRRMGLTIEQPVKPGKKKKKKAAPKPVQPKLPKPPVIRAPTPPTLPPERPVVGLGVSVEELRRSSCRYPSGAAPPYSFCGLTVEPGCSYCPFHHRLTRHSPPPPRRRHR